MRVALISSVQAIPAIEGNRKRLLNLSRAIRALGHELDFVLLEGRGTAGFDRAAQEAEFGAGFHAVDRGPLHRLVDDGRRLAGMAMRRLRGTLGRAGAFDHGLDELWSGGFDTALARLAAARRYDAVIVAYVFNSRAFRCFKPGVLRLLDTHDSFADRQRRVGGRSERDYWFSLRPEVEDEGFRRADIVLAIQEEEAERFERRLGSPPPRVATVSHLVDDGPRVTDYASPDAIFVGSANGPNLAAMRSFSSRTLPILLARRPGFRLHLVGSIGDAIDRHPSIVRHGRVGDVMEIYRQAPLSLNPMESGTGINIKLLDAMGCAVPTVSTETGVRGLGASFAGGVSIVPDADPDAFADAVLALCADPAERAAMGERAFEAARAWNARQRETLAALLAGAAR